MNNEQTHNELLRENEELRWQLSEANDTINAIRTGQVDALVVNGENGHEIYSLKTADQTYRVFIEKMNEGALTLNEAGLVLYCNSRVAEIVALPISSVLGQPFTTFIADDSLALFDALFARGWQTDEKMEIVMKGNDKLVPCQLSVTTLQLDDGLALSVILTDLSYQKEVQDLLKENNTRLQEANTALERSNHDLQQFASVASHDLQEPLRKMLIYSNTLQIKLGDAINDEITGYIDKISKASARMKQLVSDILKFTKTGVVDEDFTPVNLNSVINDILDDYELLIKEKDAVVTVTELPVITGSRGQLRQLFQNLIANSLKFSRAGVPPTIHIYEATRNGGSCLIEVADNGIGFSNQYNERIFSLFERLNTKDEYEGSGIGLSIARKIAEGHRGSITVSSHEGEGSTFKVQFPLC